MRFFWSFVIGGDTVPFIVKNIRRSKPIVPGMECAMRRAGEVVGTLLVDESDHDKIHVAIRGGGFVVGSRNGAGDIAGDNVTLTARDFVIRDTRTRRAFLVVNYQPPVDELEVEQ